MTPIEELIRDKWRGSGAALARKAGMSRRAYFLMLESGRCPKVDVLMRLADALKCTAIEVLITQYPNRIAAYKAANTPKEGE